MVDILIDNLNVTTSDWIKYSSDNPENYNGTHWKPKYPYELSKILQIHTTYHSLCGCCGARVIYTIEDFNKTETYKPDWSTLNYMFNSFNRGICIGLNIDKKDIEKSRNSEVWEIQLGDKTIFTRFRLEH